MKISLAELIQDYAKVLPENFTYYLPYVYKCKLPTPKTPDYYKTLSLLKFLEQRNQFHSTDLSRFL